MLIIAMDIPTAISFIGAFISLACFCDGVPIEDNFSFQMDILNNIGVSEPWKFPTISKETISIPDDIRRKYESMQRKHRVRRAYITKGIHKNEDIFGDVTFTDRKRQLFTFDISDIPEGSEIVMAELKIFKERPNHSIFKPLSDEEAAEVAALEHDHVPTAAVSIHQVMAGDDVDMDLEPAELASEISDMEDEFDTTVIDERELPLNSSGWKIFDVTTTVQTWTADPESNLGLQLRVDPIQDGHHARRVANEIRFATEFHPDSPDSSPVLIIYTTKYAPRDEPNDCLYEGEEDVRCCRRRKYVDFRDLSWTNRWIIEPAGFEAYECYGPCHNHRNRSIRDLFRLPSFGSRSRSSSGRRAHYATCGIARSSSLPMMYLIERDGVTELEVEDIPNMIVEDCECTQ